MFDRNREFEVKILSGEEKRCVLRFPTDAEFAERTRKRKATRRVVGRGKTEYAVPNAEQPDAQLFQQIRLDRDGEPFDAAEAAAAIERIERCRVVSAEREGNQFRIELQVPGARVVHILGIPTKADTLNYGRVAVKTVEGRRSQDIMISLDPSAELWGKVQREVEGYADPENVPIIHKDVAVVELLAQVDAATEDDDPEY